MTDFSKLSTRERLEILYQYDQVELVAPFSLSSLLVKLWQTLLRVLDSSGEPRIWQQRDRSGEIWWSAYDPKTERSIYQVSEQELRSWLEQRYYQ